MEAGNVLFVAYEFPPEGCRGTKRAMKFLKYLRPMGWNPIILTVKDGNYEFHDGLLFAELPPDLRVFRTYTFENLFYKHNYKENEIRDARSDKDRMKRTPNARKLLLKIYHNIGKVLRIPD